MRQPLWTPSQQRVKESNITGFIAFVNKRYGLRLESYHQLHNWSVNEIPAFWSAVWDFVGIKSSQPYTQVVDDLAKFPGARWFPDAKLNFAENLLKRNDDHLAFIFRGETQRTARMTYHELHCKVASLAKWLRTMGLRQGDRVCAYTPNLIEAVIAMLASTSVGATWASCGAELGPAAVLDRLGQVQPSFMFTSDGYFYGSKAFSILSNAEEVAKKIPSLKRVIVVPYVSSKPPIENMSGFTLFDDIVSSKHESQTQFEQLPFDHPVYIMFSSGTTGKPKCMVQGVGVLLNQLTDLVLDADLKESDKITYITSASWMMWNWLVSSLAVGATIILYDGNPNYPDWTAMWKLIQEEAISIFGCSATYINHLKTINATPGKVCNLSTLREISQTGSPLSSEGFEWIYREIKQDLHFNSISGGTDINATFASGNPTLPVYAGEISAPTLGMKISAYDESGRSVFDQEGELVCEAPAPSMPLYFWKDENNEKYLAAYFNFYQAAGRNVWRHGDFIVVHSDTQGITFLGRSDSVLKPSGVRIGTAEIYNVVDKFPEISDSLVVGQNWKGDQRIILFVKLNSGYTLTEDLKSQIKQTLRSKASPRHVPALIIETPSIPYTFNMKKVESAVRNILDGKPVPNRDAITNPESLEYFERILPELQK